MPAAAMTSPSSLPPTFMAITPPRRPARAFDAACCTLGTIVERTGPALRGRDAASTRPPARRRPPGVPRSSSSSARSRPEIPTWASSGTPSARSSSRRSGGIGPSSPPIEARVAGSSSSPLASRSGARSGSSTVRSSCSPSRTPGKVRCGAQATRGSPSCSSIGSTRSSSTSPKTRVRTRSGTRTASPSTSAAPTATPAAVAVARGVAVRGGELLLGRAAARLVGDHVVHRGVIAARVGRGVVLPDPLLGGLVEHADDGAAHESERTDEEERHEVAGDAAAPSLGRTSRRLPVASAARDGRGLDHRRLRYPPRPVRVRPGLPGRRAVAPRLRGRSVPRIAAGS